MINDGSNYLKKYTVLVLENRPDEAKRVMFVSQQVCLFSYKHLWPTTSFMITFFFQIGFLQSEFVPLWACRVQHLRPYYCGVKPKQQGKAVISCCVWYLPLLMLSWLTALSCFIIISLHQQQLLETCEKELPPTPTHPLPQITEASDIAGGVQC